MISKQDIDTIKRRIRKLKKLEIKIRFNNNKHTALNLIWDDFFDLKEKPLKNSKYTLSMIASMNHDEYKNMIDEYFTQLFLILNNGGITITYKKFDKATLNRINLPSYSDEKDIKKRFRELAVKYHPDAGGDTEKFIELMSIYNELIK